MVNSLIYRKCKFGLISNINNVEIIEGYWFFRLDNMKFKINFWQALDWSNFFFIEKYVYHSQFTSKFFFGLHNSFLLLNYNNSFICIKRALNFIEASVLNRNYIIGLGEFYNFFIKFSKFYKYLNIYNLRYLPDGFLTNFKQYFSINNIFNLKNKSKINLKYLSKSNFINQQFNIDKLRKQDFIKNKSKIKFKLNPPTIAILFDIKNSFWILNELKIIKLPVIGLVYPKTELNSKLIHYPIPILNGLNEDFLLDEEEKIAISDFEEEQQQLQRKRREQKKILQAQGYIVKQSHALDFLKNYKENIIDVFFLFLFILITFQSYKKLLLKFTNKSIRFFESNSIIVKLNNFNSVSHKRFLLSKRFYKKSFLRFYVKLWSKLPLNRNLLFENKKIELIDRSLIWKPVKKVWQLKKRLRKQNKFILSFKDIYYNKPKFWLQKKYIVKFKGFNLIKRFKFYNSKLVPFIKTLIKRNLISKPTQRISTWKLQKLNFNRSKLDYTEKSDLFSFLFKIIRNHKKHRIKYKRRQIYFQIGYSWQKKKRIYISSWKTKSNQNFYFKDLRLQKDGLNSFFSKNLIYKYKTSIKSALLNYVKYNKIKRRNLVLYLKAKLNNNIINKKSSVFFSFYSAKYWWYYKKPIIIFSQLKYFNKDNVNFKKYYNLFLQDYQWRLFNLKFNKKKSRSYFLTSHDIRLLKKLLLTKRILYKLKKKKTTQNLIILKQRYRIIGNKFKIFYRKKLKQVLFNFKTIYLFGKKYRNFLLHKHKYSIDSLVYKKLLKINNQFIFERKQQKLHLYLPIVSRLNNKNKFISTLKAEAPIFYAYFNFFDKKILALKKNSYISLYYKLNTQLNINKFHREMSIYLTQTKNYKYALNNFFLKKVKKDFDNHLNLKKEIKRIGLKELKIEPSWWRSSVNPKYKRKLLFLKWEYYKNNNYIYYFNRIERNWLQNRIFSFKGKDFLFNFDKKASLGLVKHWQMVNKKLSINQIINKFKFIYNLNSNNKDIKALDFILKNRISLFNNLSLNRNLKIKKNQLSELISQQNLDLKNFNLLKLKKNILSFGFNFINYKRNLKSFVFKWKKFEYNLQQSIIINDLRKYNYKFQKIILNTKSLKKKSKFILSNNLNFYISKNRISKINIKYNFDEKKSLISRIYSIGLLLLNKEEQNEDISHLKRRLKQRNKKKFKLWVNKQLFYYKKKYFNRRLKKQTFFTSTEKYIYYFNNKLFNISQIYLNLPTIIENKFSEDKFNFKFKLFSYRLVNTSFLKKKLIDNEHHVFHDKLLKNKFVIYHYLYKIRRFSFWKKIRRNKKLKRYNLFRSILIKLILKKMLKDKDYVQKFKTALKLLTFALSTNNNKLIDLFYINVRFRYRKLIKNNSVNLNFIQSYSLYRRLYYKNLKKKKLINRMLLVRKKLLKNFKDKKWIKKN